MPTLLVPADTGDEAWTRDKRSAVDAAIAALPDGRAHWFSPADHDIHAQYPTELADVLALEFPPAVAAQALAETVGSVASYHVIGQGDLMPVGLEVNANHLRPVSEGFVTAICRPVHLGRTTHVWDIRLHDVQGRATCISRLTVAIVPKPRLS